MDITIYHWVWYLLGFIACPRLTFAILATIYFNLPVWLSIIIWVVVILNMLLTKKGNTNG